jgi:hypothetical protein
MAEQTPMSPLRRFFYRLGVLAAFVLLLVLVAGAWLLGRFGADTAVAYKDDLEHFNYGSLGSEHEFGVPYWIWRALPELPGPGGLASLGVAWEQGQELPIGFTTRRNLNGFITLQQSSASGFFH